MCVCHVLRTWYILPVVCNTPRHMNRIITGHLLGGACDQLRINNSTSELSQTTSISISDILRSLPIHTYFLMLWCVLLSSCVLLAVGHGVAAVLLCVCVLCAAAVLVAPYVFRIYCWRRIFVFCIIYLLSFRIQR